MVIQRWQSVMLLIAGVMMGLFSFMSLGQIQTPDYSFNITALGIMREGIPTEAGEAVGVHTYAAFVVSLLACVLPLVGIFCFKKMKLHKSVVLQSLLFTVISVMLLAYDVYSFAGEFVDSVGWSFMICAPFVALVAEIAAYRMICSDWSKLRAADRLR